MSLRTSANRYARALFDVTLREGDLAQVDRDLDAMVDLTTREAAALQPAFRHGVPGQARRAVIEQSAGALGLSQTATKLIAMLAEGGRFELLPHVAEAFRERLLAHQNIVRASVTSAAPLSAEHTQALEQSLGRATGKNVQLSVAVDPALIGGVVARIGSTVYDGSVTRQLQRMRERLAKNV